MNLKPLGMRFASFALCMIISANTPSSGSAQVESPKGSIKGSIVDQGEAAPIPQARVWIHEQSGRFSFEARPDASGKFTIDVPAGYYFLFVGAAGFAPICKSVWVKPDKPIVLRLKMGPDTENLQQ